MSIRKWESKKSKNDYVWEVYFVYNKNGISEWYSKSGFLTKKEAQEHETLLKNKLIETGKIHKERSLTLNEVMDEFLSLRKTGYSETTITNTNTIDDYRKCKSQLGYIKIKEIDYKILQSFFNIEK